MRFNYYNSRNQDVIEDDEIKLDLRFMDRDSKAKTYRSHLISNIQKCGNDKNIEMLKMWEEELRIFNEFYPQKIVKNEITILDGWKGKDKIDIYKGFDNDFRILEHLKDKDTGEVAESVKIVKKADLNRIVFIIKNLELGVAYKCYYIAKKLGYEDWKELWKERKEYFTKYYYPIKVMEALGVIHYSGRGTITRIL